MQFRGKKREISLSLFWILLLVIFVPLLLRLTFWQLERAEERKLAQIQFQKSIARPPLPIDDPSLLSQEKYVRTQVDGAFDWSRQFILTNQVHNTVAGYEVLTPLIYSDGKAILVSRGWLPPSPGKVPNLRPPTDEFDKLSVTGLAVKPAPRMASYQRDIAMQSGDYELGNTDPALASWPVFIEEENFEQMASLLELELIPRVLQPDDNKFSYMRVWQPSSRSPTVNYGYAAQWFGMMLLLVGTAIYMNTKRIAQDDN